MTALTVPAGGTHDADPQPVPLRRMAWVTWRQHRFALTAAASALCAVAIGIWIAGLHLHRAYAAALAACHPASSVACGDMVTSFNGMNLLLASGFVLQAVPALIGAFVGAPVLARELETGTFRYAWTQGIGRWRWTIAKLVPLAVTIAAASGALSVLLSWYYRPYLGTGNQAIGLTQWSPLSDGMFAVRGVAFAAWTLAAFAIGALAGLLIRRVVPAIGATLAACTGLAFATGLYLRQHYLTPLVSRNLLNPPASAYLVSQWWTKGGTLAFAGVRDADGLPPMNFLQRVCPRISAGNGKPSPGGILQCFNQHGYTMWTGYQPASRFWPFQWIEGGWLLALSVLLIAATVWLVRRRAA
jgi:hypothetical protein